SLGRQGLGDADLQVGRVCDLDAGEVLVDPDPARALPEQVQSAVAPDGGDPATEAVGVPVEAMEVAHGLAPRLRGDVLGVLTADEHFEVAQQGCLDSAVDRAEGLGVARAHALDGIVEDPLTGHRSMVPRQASPGGISTRTPAARSPTTFGRAGSTLSTTRSAT